MPQDDQPEPLLTPKDVSEWLRVSTATVNDWASKGRLPWFKTPGGQRRFRRADVEQFIERG